MEEPLINIDINIGENNTANLRIEREEDIEFVLKQFCEYYNLNEEIYQTLMEQLIHNLNVIRETEGAENQEEQSLKDEPKTTKILNKSKSPVPHSRKQTENENERRIALTPDKNFRGLQLYKRHQDKEIKRKENKEKTIEQRKYEEMVEATFKPQLDSKSMKIAKLNLDKSFKTEDRLINYGQRSMNKITKMKTVKLLKDNSFSYTPTISDRSNLIAEMNKKTREKFMQTNNFNTRSFSNLPSSKKNETNTSFDNLTNTQKKFVENKSRSKTKEKKISESEKFRNQISNKISENFKKTKVSDRFKTGHSFVQRNINNSQFNQFKLNTTQDFLYEEAKLLHLKKEVESKNFYDKNYPFTPQIKSKIRDLFHKDETISQFLNRMVTSKKKTEELLVEVRKREAKSEKDTKTGQKLYVPKVNRGPVKEIDREINLDSYYDLKLLENKNKIQSEELINNLEKKKHFLENSMKIVLKMKIERYKQIFDLLDYDHDGFISSKSIKLSNLPPDTLEALTPLLEELQSKNLRMNFKDFCLAGDKHIGIKIFPK